MSKAPFFDQKIETNIEENNKDDDEEKFLRESFDLAHDIVVKWTNKSTTTNQKIEKKKSPHKKIAD